MSQVTKQLDVGIRWVRCGWRLFRREPWLLFGMGFCSSVVVLVPTFLTFVGPPLVGLFVPALLASFFVALDRIAQQKRPATPRMEALKQSPRSLLLAFQDENWLLQVVMISLYGMVAVVLADILLYLIVGGVWTQPSAGFVRLVFASLVAAILYAVIAASLIYTLPLALLEKAPLVPAMARSFRTSARYVAGLLVPALLVVAPVLIGSILSWLSVPLAYIAGLLTGAISVPLCAASLYCSYRTVFSPPASTGKPQPVVKRDRVRAA